MPPIHPGMTVSHFVVRTGQADAIQSFCLRAGFQLGELIEYDCAQMPSYRRAKYFGRGRSRLIPGNVLNLPVHTGVQKDDARRMCATIGDFFDGQPL